MDRDEPERGARIYDLDEYRARTSTRASIVIDRDGSWHRPRPDSIQAAASRHPSAISRGRGRAPER